LDFGWEKWFSDGLNQPQITPESASYQALSVLTRSADYPKLNGGEGKPHRLPLLHKEFRRVSQAANCLIGAPGTAHPPSRSVRRNTIYSLFFTLL
jgi:hypothetical protein